MKNRAHFSRIALILSLLVTSCAPAYIPNVVNTPLLSNKGEFQAAVHGGISGVDPQLSYALTDHVGLMLNGSFANNTSDSTDNYHRHQFIEFGAGYFQPLGANTRFETFAGAGIGNLQAEFTSDLWYTSTNTYMNRYFLQPAVGLTFNAVDANLASRLVYVQLNQDNKKNSGWFLEPVVTGKIGYKTLKGVVQIGVALPLNEQQIDFNYQPFLFSLGLQATFNKIYTR